MKAEINFIITRAKITRHAQDDLKSGWTWNEMTLDQWDNEIVALQSMREICSSARYTRNRERVSENWTEG